MTRDEFLRELVRRVNRDRSFNTGFRETRAWEFETIDDGVYGVITGDGSRFIIDVEAVDELDTMR